MSQPCQPLSTSSHNTSLWRFPSSAAYAPKTPLSRNTVNPGAAQALTPVALETFLAHSTSAHGSIPASHVPLSQWTTMHKHTPAHGCNVTIARLHLTSCHNTSLWRFLCAPPPCAGTSTANDNTLHCSATAHITYQTLSLRQLGATLPTSHCVIAVVRRSLHRCQHHTCDSNLPISLLMASSPDLGPSALHCVRPSFHWESPRHTRVWRAGALVQPRWNQKDSLVRPWSPPTS